MKGDMMKMPLARMLLTICASATLAAGCVTAALSPDPSATDYEKPPQTEAPLVLPSPSCIDVSVPAGDEIPRTIDNMAGMSELVVVGEFKGLGKARWNSSDGTKPKDVTYLTPAIIERPVLIKTETAVRGDGSRAVHATLRGGTIGCDRWVFEGDPVPSPGVRYVFWLMRTIDSSGGPSTDLNVLEAWPIDAKNLVQTPLDGSLSLSDFAAKVAAVPYKG
jgi:hypothetical protein